MWLIDGHLQEIKMLQIGEMARNQSIANVHNAILLCVWMFHWSTIVGHSLGSTINGTFLIAHVRYIDRVQPDCCAWMQNVEIKHIWMSITKRLTHMLLIDRGPAKLIAPTDNCNTETTTMLFRQWLMFTKFPRQLEWNIVFFLWSSQQ